MPCCADSKWHFYSLWGYDLFKKENQCKPYLQRKCHQIILHHFKFHGYRKPSKSHEISIKKKRKANSKHYSVMSQVTRNAIFFFSNFSNCILARIQLGLAMMINMFSWNITSLWCKVDFTLEATYVSKTIYFILAQVITSQTKKEASFLWLILI